MIKEIIRFIFLLHMKNKYWLFIFWFWFLHLIFNPKEERKSLISFFYILFLETLSNLFSFTFRRRERRNGETLEKKGEKKKEQITHKEITVQLLLMLCEIMSKYLMGNDFSSHSHDQWDTKQFLLILLHRTCFRPPKTKGDSTLFSRGKLVNWTS